MVLAFAGAVLLGLTLAAVVAPMIVERIVPAASADSIAPSSTGPAAAPDPASPARTRASSPSAAPLPATSVAIHPIAREPQRVQLDRPPRPEPADERARATRPPDASGASPRRIATREPSAARAEAPLGLAPVRVARPAEAAVRERAIGPHDTPARSTASLDPEGVRRVVRGGQHRLRQCYVTAMRRHGLAADVELRMTVDVDHEGFVSAITVDGHDFGGLVACLRRTAIRWRFPPSRDGGRIPIPLAFRALQ